MLGSRDRKNNVREEDEGTSTKVHEESRGHSNGHSHSQSDRGSVGQDDQSVMSLFCYSQAASHAFWNKVNCN